VRTLFDADIPHTEAQSRRFSFLVAAAIVVAYWFTQHPLPRWTASNPDINLYVAQPLMWLAVAGIAGYGWVRLEDRPPLSRTLIGIALLVGLFHVALLVIAGVLGDFGDSLSAGRLLNYPKNFLYISTLLAGMETARAYLFHVWKGVDQRLAFGAVAVVFAALALTTGQLATFGSADEMFTGVGGRWIPALGISILATALVSLGGIGPSWAYRLVVVGFEWFSPILPDLDWFVTAVLGAAIPYVSWKLIVDVYRDTREGELALYDEPEHEVAPARVPSWAITASVTAFVLAVGVLSSGILGVRMVVVEGISMEPSYSRGDVAFLVDDPDPASLEVDDVIAFEQGSIYMVHRIVDIEEGANGRVFTTQGDNNNHPDDSITADVIRGKVVFLVPAVGAPLLWLRGG
jgi:signal peptidase